MQTLNSFLFIVLPYLSLIIFLMGTIQRYRATKFSYSSLSTQFLEGRNLFWGTMLFHWSIILLFFGHLIGFLIPSSVLAWNNDPIRLVILEAVAFTFGLASLIGLTALLVRRLTNPRIRQVSNIMDLIVEVLILAQIVLGVWVAFGFRWGSSWFASVLAPYLYSIFNFNPNINAVAALPLVIKLHIMLAFVILLLIPFSRLVHLLVYPFHYLWRPYQQVIWYWNKKKIRNAGNGWSVTKPKNN